MQQDPYDRRGRAFFSGLVWMLTGGTIAAALLIGLNHQISDRLFAALNALLNPPQPQPQVDVQSLTLQKIRDASELTTAEFTMQAVVPTEQDATFSGFTIGTTKLLYIAQGEVQAGVDLSQLAPAQMQVTGDRIVIKLPPARILNSKIDVNKSQVYDYNRGFLGLGPDAGPQLQSLAQQEALQKIVTTACEQGVLQRASDRAKLAVTQLLTAAGYKTVTVDTQPPLMDTCTPTPTPPSPSPSPSSPTLSPSQ
ncbi:MAG: hypothetical protein OHK0047_41040 [Leptolyngbyaceae cyanobacterium]